MLIWDTRKNLQVIWVTNLRDRIAVKMAKFDAQKKALDKFVEEGP